ncbi:DUF481 domain-containing protein [Paraglaciecola aquimarina]|uniref:DUF481 domain-containing protein n=1 Tax=Paraglaciecola algarum TaxID=3050085 RepID=A0ABS9D6Y3_9ALTE|nr:DUF481 domain-containing protein [Paraglaciecola sp. G1-23]MCF2948535.1 DUF481 domain-containing protein [Paraglaciecola sp. G1-23]
MQKTLVILSLLASSQAFAADKEKPFSMDGEFGFISTSGNTDTTSIKGKISAHQELEMWSNDYKFEALYKKDEVNDVSQTTAQKYFLSGQGNYKLANPDHRVFGFVSHEDDRFSSFDYQSTIAAGWSQKLWQDDDSKFSYSIGPGYSFAKRQTGESENGLIVRASMDYRLKISETAQFKQLVSSEVGSDNTKSKSESSVSAQISDGFSLKVSLVLDHNSDVPDGKENLDTQTAVTLVYTFF